MTYRLKYQVSFCRVGGRSVFLDVARDRYFCLGAAMEEAFRRILHGECLSRADQAEFLKLGLVETADVDGPILPTVATPPSSSLLELAHPEPPRLKALLSGGVALAGTRRRLRRRSLGDCLDRIRRRKAEAGDLASNCSLTHATRYNQARPKLPFPAACLPDALALLEVLANENCFPDLVFGVRLTPFGAHCWVQDGSVVLNDPLDHVLAHTPILVI